MYGVKTPGLLKLLFKKLTWDVPVKSKTLFLTFDDGPTPQVTEFVLTTLAQFNAKATFFCLGKNIERHPAIFKKILLAGHGIGNHTYSHKNGWKTANEIYLNDVAAFPYRTKLFRPPYGRISLSQIALLKSEYSIIMWDVLSGDFDTTISNEQCLSNVIDHARPGSIIVFHDSMIAQERMEYALPKVLEHYTTKGYCFEKI